MIAQIVTVATWLIAHWKDLAVSFAALVASASLFVKALEVLVSILLAVFPGLKNADGTLKHVAGWLDALGKNSWLNSMALSPKAKA